MGNKKLEKEYDMQAAAVKGDWASIYNDVAVGLVDCAYWDAKAVERPGYRSFIRYVLHRSTKHDGFLQLSIMEIRNEKMIPTSDSQYNSVDDFIRNRALGSGAEIVHILILDALE